MYILFPFEFKFRLFVKWYRRQKNIALMARDSFILLLVYLILEASTLHICAYIFRCIETNVEIVNHNQINVVCVLSVYVAHREAEALY